MKVRYLKLPLLFMLAMHLSFFSSNSNSNTDREALEQFELSSLRYDSYSFRPCGSIAYIRDPNGYIHIAMVGTLLGKHYGKIDSISNEELIISEVYPDGKDSWKEIKKVLHKEH